MSAVANTLTAALARPARAAAASSARPAPQAAPCRARWSPDTPRSLQTAPHGCRRHRRRSLQRAAQQRPGDGSHDALVSEFNAYVNEQGIPELLRDRRPTHLMSPLACIASQLAALQVGGALALGVFAQRRAAVTRAGYQARELTSPLEPRHLLCRSAVAPNAGRHRGEDLSASPLCIHRSATTGRSRMRACRRRSCLPCPRVLRSCWQHRCGWLMGPPHQPKDWRAGTGPPCWLNTRVSVQEQWHGGCSHAG